MIDEICKMDIVTPFLLIICYGFLNVNATQTLSLFRRVGTGSALMYLSETQTLDHDSCMVECVNTDCCKGIEFRRHGNLEMNCALTPLAVTEDDIIEPQHGGGDIYRFVAAPSPSECESVTGYPRRQELPEVTTQPELPVTTPPPDVTTDDEDVDAESGFSLEPASCSSLTPDVTSSYRTCTPQISVVAAMRLQTGGVVVFTNDNRYYSCNSHNIFVNHQSLGQCTSGDLRSLGNVNNANQFDNGPPDMAFSCVQSTDSNTRFFLIKDGRMYTYRYLNSATFNMQAVTNIPLPSTLPTSGTATCLWPPNGSSGIHRIHFLYLNWVIQATYSWSEGAFTSVGDAEEMRTYNEILEDGQRATFLGAPCDAQAMLALQNSGQFLYFVRDESYFVQGAHNAPDYDGTLWSIGNTCT